MSVPFPFSVREDWALKLVKPCTVLSAYFGPSQWQNDWAHYPGKSSTVLSARTFALLRERKIGPVNLDSVPEESLELSFWYHRFFPQRLVDPNDGANNASWSQRRRRKRRRKWRTSSSDNPVAGCVRNQERRRRRTWRNGTLKNNTNTL